MHVKLSEQDKLKITSKLLYVLANKVNGKSVLSKLFSTTQFDVSGFFDDLVDAQKELLSKEYTKSITNDPRKDAKLQKVENLTRDGFLLKFDKLDPNNYDPLYLFESTTMDYFEVESILKESVFKKIKEQKITTLEEENNEAFKTTFNKDVLKTKIMELIKNKLISAFKINMGTKFPDLSLNAPQILEKGSKVV